MPSSQVAGVLSGWFAPAVEPCGGSVFKPILPVSNPLLEFHMGIRITSKTWRAPLQLIDSWLPTPAQRCMPRRPPLGPLLQRFARAGWLGRHPETTEHTHHHALPGTRFWPTAPNSMPVRIVRPAKSMRGSARLVISGRMADVCAELDRLAALEQHASAT